MIFGIELNYSLIMIYHLYIVAGLSVAYVISILCQAGRNYVNDNEYSYKGDTNNVYFFPLFVAHDCDAFEDCWWLLLLGSVVGTLIAICWVVAYPLAAIYGILFTLRKWTRFTKEVKKALETKSDMSHTHPIKE